MVHAGLLRLNHDNCRFGLLDLSAALVADDGVGLVVDESDPKDLLVDLGRSVLEDDLVADAVIDLPIILPG